MTHTQENLKKYKAKKMAALGKIIPEIINGLSVWEKRRLLEGKSVDEWVQSSIEQYEQDFDLYVWDYGSMGANETVWKNIVGCLLGDTRESVDNGWNHTGTDWKDHGLYHDRLLKTSDDIATCYRTLAYSFPSHPDATKWKELGEEWTMYWDCLRIPSMEEAERETAMLSAAYNEALDIRKKMENKMPGGHWSILNHN